MTQHPDFGSFTVILYKAVLSVIVTAIYLNSSFKYCVWDSIDRSLVKGLAWKVIMGQYCILNYYTGIFFWSLTMCASLDTMTPLCVYIIARGMLGEKARLNSIIAVACVISGTFAIILGAP